MPMTASLPRGRPIASAVDRLRRARDRAGRAPRLALRHDQHPVRPGGGKRRAFGDAPAAGRAKCRRRALRQARRLDEEARSGKKPRRHAEFRRERVDPRLGKLQLDRDDRCDRARRQPGLGKGRAREIRDFLGGTAALAADPERQDRRVEHQGVGFRFPCPVRHDDAVGCPVFAQRIAPARNHSAQPVSSTKRDRLAAAAAPPRPASPSRDWRYATRAAVRRARGRGAHPRRWLSRRYPPISSAIARASALAP